MNPEQIYDLFAGLKQANGTLVRMADYFEGIDDKIGELECIDRKLCAMWTQLERIAGVLERIANVFEMKETRSLTLKVENCFGPSDGPLASQEPESVDEKEKEDD